MPDDKFGRLLTEDDAKKLIAAVAPEWSAEDVENLFNEFDEHNAFKFPVDEPLFLLRGKDKAAWETTVKYIEECERIGASDEHVRAAQHASGKMLAWQQLNKHLVEIPD